MIGVNVLLELTIVETWDLREGEGFVVNTFKSQNGNKIEICRNG